MAEVHQAPSGGKGGDLPAALDLQNPAAVRAWLGDLRTQVDDLFAAAEDATLPLGMRALGRATARATVLEARRAIDHLLAAAEKGAGA